MANSFHEKPGVSQVAVHKADWSRFSKEVKGDGTPKIASFLRFPRVRP
jgi:hypothetical protein